MHPPFPVAPLRLPGAAIRFPLGLGLSGMTLAILPLGLSLAAFRISPLLAIAMQLLLLGALVGKLPFFLLAIFAAMPFQQSLFGGESSSAANVSMVDVLASLMMVTLLASLPARRTLRLGPVAFPMGIYLGILGASSLSNWEGFTTAVSLLRMLMATLVAVLIFANFKTAYHLAHRGFEIFLGATSVLAIFTLLAFVEGGVEASMYTFGINKNALGPTFGCGILTCLCYLSTEKPSRNRAIGLRWALALCTVGCFLSLSRGAWLATALSSLFLLRLIKNKPAFWRTLALLVPLIAVLWRLLPAPTAEYASNISTSAYTVQTRLQTIGIVLDSFRSSPWMGVGIGLRKTVEPHNVLILTLGESGIIGLIGFLGMFAGGFYTLALALRKTRVDLPNRQLVLIGISILLLSLVHGCMDVYWRRGIGFLGWAGVGLAVQILSTVPAASRGQKPLNQKPLSGRGRGHNAPEPVARRLAPRRDAV